MPPPADSRPPSKGSSDDRADDSASLSGAIAAAFTTVEVQSPPGTRASGTAPPRGPKSRNQAQGLARLPLFLLIWGVAALSMYLPAVHALAMRDYDTSRVFFYGGTMGLFIVTLLGIARTNRVARNGTLGQLLSLFATFALLPVFMAVPVQESLRNTTFINAYFDMVSALTTTGADVWADPGRLPPSVHLWRGQVAWLGGFLMWVAAAAILALAAARSP